MGYKDSDKYKAQKAAYERIKAIRTRVFDIIAPQAINELDELFRLHAAGGMGQFLTYGILKRKLIWHELDEKLKAMPDTSDQALSAFVREFLIKQLVQVVEQVRIDAGIPA